MQRDCKDLGCSRNLVRIGDFRSVPFEDLAVKMEAKSIEELKDYVRPQDDPSDVSLKPFVATHDALEMLNEWRRNNRLSTNSRTGKFWANLHEIADQVHEAAGLNRQL